MAKKNSNKGLDKLLGDASTSKMYDLPEGQSEQVKEPEAAYYFKMPVSIKKEMEIYCIVNDLNLKDLLVEGAKMYMKKNP